MSFPLLTVTAAVPAVGAGQTAAPPAPPRSPPKRHARLLDEGSQA
ncbi:hypothetical protein ACFXB3_14040, partial [Streptomyces sp. NPDC059447]